jgi:hypothetical protein
VIRLAALNLAPVALLIAVGHAGHLDRFLDPSLAVSCALVALPALAGIVTLCRRAWLGTPTSDIREYSAWTVTAGLIGTVLGFIIALDAIDPRSAADLSTMTPMMAHMIVGMSIALHTTLVGAVGGLWLRVLLRYVR